MIRKPIVSFLRAAAVIVPAILLAGMASGRLAGAGFGNPWFDALRKPWFMPPGPVFPIVWATLYVLMGVAAALVWTGPRRPGRRLSLKLFAAQLALNLAWSPLFFAAHRVTLAFWTVVAMLALAGGVTWLFWRIRRAAAVLMAPYLGWLVLAAALTREVGRLNG